MKTLIGTFATIGEIREVLDRDGWKVKVSNNWTNPDHPGCSREVQITTEGFAVTEIRLSAPDMIEVEALIARYTAEHLRLQRGDPLRIEGQKDLARAELLWQVIKDLRLLVEER